MLIYPYFPQNYASIICHGLLVAFHGILEEFLPSARMRSEGTVVGYVCVCVSVTLNLTSRVSVRLTKDTTYLTGNEGQKICGIFSETAPLQS